LSALEAAKAELARRERERPRVLSQEEHDRLLALGPDLATVWHAATTTPRDRKELLRALLEEVIIKVERDKAAAHLTLRWKGGALNEIDLALPRSRPATIRTDEDTIALVRRLAGHYPDAVIAGILNRQGRTTAYGHRFEASRVGNLRRHWDIPCFEPKAEQAGGELLTISKAAVVLGVAGTARLTRVMRANLLDELHKPYVTTARAKGLSEWRLVLRYPARLALNPLVSTIGWYLPLLFSGSLIVATVMNLPNIGPLLLRALINQDMYLAGSILLIYCFLTIVGTLISDILLAWLDPRIRIEEG